MLQTDREPTQAELNHAYQEYRAAMTAWRSANKVGSTRAEPMTERLLAARVALYRTLQATGWEAPAWVAQQLERDAALIEAPEDFEALLVS